MKKKKLQIPRIGDIVIDYNDEKYPVVRVSKRLAELKYYDTTGAMSEWIKHVGMYKGWMVAVKTKDKAYPYYVYVLGGDGVILYKRKGRKLK